MKIKTLKLKNINALVGHWQIDFDSHQFYSQGIFAILGATGSGKTTILDAICLAIYGETPRLGKISKSENALMSIGTSECSASVELILNKTAYRFEFSQRRARNLADGALQEPKHDIYELKNGDFKLISDKKSQSEKLAINLLKMDFTQFTRSVMLAQGGFSAFLQSKSEERAEILEKITGTEIYAKIGAKAFEIYKQKELVLKEKYHKLNEISIINDDEFSSLELKIQTNDTHKKTLNKSIDEITHKISLIHQYRQLNSNRTNNQKVLENLNTDLESFKSNIVQLEQAKHYHHLSPIYQQILFLKKQNQELMDNKTQLTHKFSQLSHKLLTQQTDIKTSQNNLTIANQVFEDWQPKLLELKTLTKNLEQLFNDKKTIQIMIDENNANLMQLQNQSLQYHTLLKNNQQTLSENQYFLEKYHHITTINLDNDINTPIVILKNEIEKLIEKENARKQNQDELDVLQKEIHKQKSELEYQKNLSDKQQLTINKLINNLSITLQTDNELHFFDKIEQLKFDLDNKREIYKNISEFINEFRQFTQKKYENEQQLNELESHQELLNSIQIKFGDYNQNLTHLKHNYQLLKQTYELTNEIHKLSDYIATIQDGSPCPLCGSKHHPYKQDPPKLDNNIITLKAELTAKDSEIQNTEQQLKECENQIIDTNNQIKYHQYIIKQSNIDIENKTLELTKKWGKFYHYLNGINYSVNFSELTEQELYTILDQLKQDGLQLKETYHNCCDDFKTYQEQKISIKANDDLIKILSEQFSFNNKQQKILIDDLKNKHSDLILILNHLSSYIVHLLGFINNNTTLIHQITGNNLQQKEVLLVFNLIDTINNKLITPLKQEDIQSFYSTIHQIINQSKLAINELNQIKTLINQAINTYQQRLLEQAKLKHSIDELKTQINNNDELLNNQTNKLNKLKYDLTNLETKFQNLQNNKLEKFGDIDAEIKEKTLANDIQYHKDILTEKSNQIKLINNELINIQDNINNIDTKQENNKTELLSCEQYFNKKLLENFKNIDEFLSAKLDENEIISMQNDYNELLSKIQNTKLIIEKDDNEIHHILENNIDIEKWDLELLNNTYQKLKEDLENALKEFGSNEILYKQAIENKHKQAELLNQINEYEKNLSYYQLLNQLIGSSDGKKYRNFAQRLTLETLLIEANKALVKMTNRYQLTTSNDSKNLLDIAVIDHYQADKIRQSKNLSGGESFIISLSLALGLSEMSSQNIQIDSLFLDEGFGTLDENALDIALTALSEIQSTGKMIGIISHISALKERIGTQILIHKKSGGKSQLAGAGVTKLD